MNMNLTTSANVSRQNETFVVLTSQHTGCLEQNVGLGLHSFGLVRKGSILDSDSKDDIHQVWPDPVHDGLYTSTPTANQGRTHSTGLLFLNECLFNQNAIAKCFNEKC